MTIATGSDVPMAPLQVICGASEGGPPAGGMRSNVAVLDEGEAPAPGGADDLGVFAGVAEPLEEVEPHAPEAIDNATSVAAANRCMSVSTYAAVGRF
jgi:hypothetical protein